MRQAEKFHRPVICFVDTSGAFCGIGAEERGQGQAIAANLMGMMALNTPIITTLIGEGGSGGALALAVADQVWILENAVYSVISPEGLRQHLVEGRRQGRRGGPAAEAHRLGCPGPGDHRAGDLGKRSWGRAASTPAWPTGSKKELQVLMHQEDLLKRRYARFRPGEPLRPAPARPHPPHRR